MSTLKSPPNKRIGGRRYVYRGHVDLLPEDDNLLIEMAFIRAGEEARARTNVVRFEDGRQIVSLLVYEDFELAAFPTLLESWFVDLERGRESYRSYVESNNPPILHRKELLLGNRHPRYKEFCSLTTDAEQIGLFDDLKRIGFRRQWDGLIRAKGYEFDGRNFVPIANAVDVGEDEVSEDGSIDLGWGAKRYLTALTRVELSAPMMSLSRAGLLEGQWSVFDYGCGKGGDVEILSENKITAHGWDPYFAPENEKHSADIVNLGFVVNVIEDPQERAEALIGAYALTKKVLVVSVMLENDARTGGKLFSDGCMTGRGTFQKYYTQAEIKSYIESVLDEEAISVAPGIHYVFRDKDFGQSFLKRKTKRRSLIVIQKKLTSEQREKLEKKKRDLRYQENKNLLDQLWHDWLVLGRLPEKDEFVFSEEIAEKFGSMKKASRFLLSMKNPDLIKMSSEVRQEDMLVSESLQLFAKKRYFARLSVAEQRDIKYFYGSFSSLQDEAKGLLRSLADTKLLLAHATSASQKGLGCLEEDGALTLHFSLVEQLPSLLRLYVECSSVLYGDYRNSDLVKIHTQTGKLTLMRFRNFMHSPLPRMEERVKINLWKQDFEYFRYGGEFPMPFLYEKSKFINEDFEMYEEQVEFEDALRLHGLVVEGYGPSVVEFMKFIKKERLEVKGYRLQRSSEIPSLEDACGDHFTFSDFVHCGETQKREQIPNLPKQIASYHALMDMARHIVDPIVDYFGMVRLTYGFCSHELSRKIPGRIDPRIDQHCCYERNTKKKQICQRGGAACDFIVEDESMLEVAQWIATSLPFDRLYFYGDDKPVHVSYGPEHSRSIVLMLMDEKSARLIPQNINLDDFLAMS